MFGLRFSVKSNYPCGFTVSCCHLVHLNINIRTKCYVVFKNVKPPFSSSLLSFCMVFHWKNVLFKTNTRLEGRIDRNFFQNVSSFVNC